MKKIFSCLVISAMMLSMVSCGVEGSEKTAVQTATENTAETEKPTAPPKYAPASEPAPVVINGDTFIGEWSCGKNRILISKNGDGYIADIEWRTGGGASMTDSRLTYNCVYDESSSVMVCSGGVLYETEYLGDGETSETRVYEDGTATMKINVKNREWQGGVLHEYSISWLDDKDDTFRDYEFDKIQ